jgi:hypothetical protein
MARNANDFTKGLAFTVQASQITAETLSRLCQDYLENRQKSLTGKTTLDKLYTQSGGNIESVEITDKNIGAFRDTARKYDISYALQKDTGTKMPDGNFVPTWIVFFNNDTQSRAKDTFDRAFKEFTHKTELAKLAPVLEQKNIKNVERENKQEHSKEPKTRERERIIERPIPDEIGFN